MKFKRFSQHLKRIEDKASRLAMTEILAELLEEASSEEVDQLVYLALGRLRPNFEAVVFNLSEKMMLRVISAAYNRPVEEVKKEFKIKGDLGEMVAEGDSKDLSVAEVYKRLMDVAVDEGQGSQDRKVHNMAALLKDLDGLSARFMVRIPVNKLRLGFSDMTVLDALSWMEKGDKSLRADLERAFNVSADIGQIAYVFKKSGLKGVAGIKVRVGVPIRTAQAERLPNAEKMVEKLKVFAVEGKWDGLRMQIHFDKGRSVTTQEDLFGDQTRGLVRIFSRNLDNQTEMFPDIIEAVQKLKVRQIILDGEAVAYDPKTQKLLPFQETVQRKRKHGVLGKAKELPIKVFVYDILYLNGESLINKTLRERRKALEKIFKGVVGNLVLAEQEIVSDAEQLNKLLRKYLNMGLEGVMCKKLDAVYQAGNRNFNWVKFKKTTQGDLVDTLDCVVMGYYVGKGKRTGFGIGAFLVGVKDEQGKIGTVAKIGTGLSDEEWLEMKKRADQVKTDKMPEEYMMDKNLKPDVWCRPQILVEIMADEITKSPMHSFGLALRFPRLVRFRDDKDQPTSRKELNKLFKLQKK